MGAGIRTDVIPTYSSSNNKIATVTNKGVVKGVKEGTVTIKATTGNLTASYRVKVETMQVSKSGKTLKITTIPKASILVRADKKVLGYSSKKVKANKKGLQK